ncbi:MAG: hypothetical protein U7M05_12400 [Candidatus Igneacidithiobacillus chanchocoensis]
MKTARYTVRFLTPAFLGDAEQNARWRTPPFKHLLREWWRVAYAAEQNFVVDVERMRQDEGKLFGNAWLENDFSKSRVRLRLERWNEGALRKNQWPADSTVSHPEVKNREGKPVPVGSALYLGYGPLTFDNGKHATALKANAAIQAGEESTLGLAYPSTAAALIERALWLAHRYGTLGGRSRNGWGSFDLLPLPPGEGWGEGQTPPLRNWKDCLDRDWPHAIGKDDKGALIWQTAPHEDWKALMRTLAIVKIGLRTQFRFTTGKDAPQPEPRHWVSYPITNHSVRSWGNNARLPNQLRFKVRPTDDGKLVGVIIHMPHLPPPAFAPDRNAIERVWQQVHGFLDAPKQDELKGKLKRVGV